MKLLTLLIAMTITMASGLHAEVAEVSQFNVQSTIYIDGAIDFRGTTKIREIMEDMAFNKLVSDEDDDVINLIIDSPGGLVYTGRKFITSMREIKDAGIEIHCYVRGIAASMAFGILTHCSRRVAYRDSELLWHPASTGADRINAPMALELFQRLNEIDQMTLSETYKAMPQASRDLIDQSFYAEDFNSAEKMELQFDSGFLEVVDVIPGILQLLNNKKLVRISNYYQQLFIFGLTRGNPWDNILYIAPGFTIPGK